MLRGSGSVVERHLAKVNVASSNLVSRSIKGQSYGCSFFIPNYQTGTMPCRRDPPSKAFRFKPFSEGGLFVYPSVFPLTFFPLFVIIFKYRSGIRYHELFFIRKNAFKGIGDDEC